MNVARATKEYIHLNPSVPMRLIKKVRTGILEPIMCDPPNISHQRRISGSPFIITLYS